MDGDREVGLAFDDDEGVGVVRPVEEGGDVVGEPTKGLVGGGGGRVRKHRRVAVLHVGFGF